MSQATSASAAISPSNPLVADRTLRIWPAVLIVACEWLAITIPGLIWPGDLKTILTGFLAPVAALALMLLWWVSASRVPWKDRLVIPLVLAIGAGATIAFADPSVKMGGMGLIMVGLPWLTTAWVAWLLVSRPLIWPARRWGLAVAILGACAYCVLIRFDGISGGFVADVHWRWAPTEEEQFLQEYRKREASPRASYASQGRTLHLSDGDWPSFRGPNRDGRLTGVRIATDWKKQPPRELWRRRVGPGWGSFTVVGSHLFTQEQRGQDEAVVCYNADTGEEIWTYNYPARFSELVAGPGPRATPTFHEGNLYCFGASGLLHCLDAASGKLIWSKDVTKDAESVVPMWGFAASPLVVNGIVSVFGAGKDGKSVLGYRITDGELAWKAGEGILSYSSTHLAVIQGVEQLLFCTDEGLTSLDPSSGKILWMHSWPAKGIARIVQPALLDGDDVLLGTGMGVGTRRIHIGKEGNVWTSREVWTTTSIKPYFNDLVIYKNNLYGFDGVFLTCVSLEDGKGRWRARGYDTGEVLLLEDQGLLLVLSEKGDIALVEAKPDDRKEIARMPAIAGKTWNHPVIAHGKLFVRNGEEAACFELTEQPALALGK
jgi:outer membrane protein assembly factor BamB